MIRRTENIFNRVPLLKGNTFQANLIFLLGIFIFIVITIDLQTDMAIEKDEISSVVVILEQTIDTTLLDEPFVSNIDLQFIGIIPIISTSIVQNDILVCLKDRSPPETHS